MTSSAAKTQDALSEANAPDQWTVGRVLDWTTRHFASHGSDTPRLDAELLLAQARGCERIQLYTRFDEPLTDAERQAMRDYVQRRSQAEPVAYIVKHREFFGLDFSLTPSVLIPRPDTETLVVETLDRLKQCGDDAPAHILEIGTGSGCIAIALASQSKRLTLIAVDVSEEALSVARHNLSHHDLADRVEFRHGSLFDPLCDEERFDLIVSNPPYVTSGEMVTLPLTVRDYEPGLALDGGPDGLSVIRPLIANAPRHLKPAGWLLIEIAPEQAETVDRLFQAGRIWRPTVFTSDLGGQTRVAAAQLGP